MSYFRAVRIYSAVESAIFAALLVFWIGGLSKHMQMVLGWTHGIAWIGLGIAVAVGCRRGVFPWALLAATVSPIGPFGSSIGLELQRRGALGGEAPAAVGGRHGVAAVTEVRDQLDARGAAAVEGAVEGAAVDV